VLHDRECLLSKNGQVLDPLSCDTHEAVPQDTTSIIFVSRDQLVSRTLRYADQHLDERLPLSALGKRAGVSTSHLVRLVTSATGVSPTRRVRLLRLKRASMQLAFNRKRSITDIALDAGFQNAESFSRAFRRAFGQSPRAFRRQPSWKAWRGLYTFQQRGDHPEMDVRIVEFPETRVAALEHRGAPHLEYETARKFIEWRIANRLSPDHHRTYGIHYTDPRTTPPEDHRMDICVSVDRPVPPNPQGVINKVIPGGRCAVVRHVGPREFIRAAALLVDEWLPTSGEARRDDPIFFHYVNVGPDVREHEMITDVYLPLR
jgi:AraC family transcriptional regulator